MTHEWMTKDLLGTGGMLRVGQRVFKIVRWTMPVRIVRYTAYHEGKQVAERAKFTTLLRELERMK